jgi:LCP family protein required for cell wall assembly
MSIPAAGSAGSADDGGTPPAPDADNAGDPHSRPPLRARRRGRRKRPGRAGKVALIAALVVAVVACLGYGSAQLTLSRYDRAVHREVLLNPDARVEPPSMPAVGGPLNFLLIGSDARRSNPAMGQRSDTIIIAHVTRALDRAYLISIPRDLLVDIPADASLGFPGAFTKINAALQYGHGGQTGMRLLASTLNRLTGVRFDGAAVIDFAGLRSVVRVLGGVRMCVDERTVSIHTGAVFEVGCRRMSDTQVLDYLRQRETLPGGDFDRQRHQQQFLKALVAEAGRRDLVLHPVLADRLIRTAAAAMVVDVGATSLPDLLFALRGIGPDRVAGVRLPTYDDMIDGISYVVPQEPLAPDLFAAVRNDALADWTAENHTWVNRI